MLTYQLQRRRFKIIAGGPMKFPNKMVINIKFSPPEAFGTSDHHIRLALIGRDTNFLLNGNTGRIRMLSKWSNIIIPVVKEEIAENASR
jgi:hypothetical protein